MSKLKNIYLKDGPAKHRRVEVAHEATCAVIRHKGCDYDYETTGPRAAYYAMEMFRYVKSD